MICETWNVHSLSRKLQEVMEEINSIKVSKDVFCFTETKKKIMELSVYNSLIKSREIGKSKGRLLPYLYGRT
jgi:exonuclease III